MTGRWLTAREVAHKLGYKHPETVLRWRRNGEGPPSIKLHNGAIRYPEDGFEEWLEERATTEQGVVTHPAGRRPPANLAVVTHLNSKED